MKKYLKGGACIQNKSLFAEKVKSQELVGRITGKVFGSQETVMKCIATAAEAEIKKEMSPRDFQRSLLHFESINILKGRTNG